ncbi:sodium:solute symporter family protein [Alicyclobacillus tolerans]|uniref:SSS family solute:Na+ symporter n=1 Tax=Alicyclobacillus tolerans TaxID=90970 RepID=A0ABT9LS86_9BACL|nr:hypothetical protein [Alicyclobacillus tengchongensis]MDP9727128.1 SSS family solute:Na+ symporter [Alicyclobacillus tengchongensis]
MLFLFLILLYTCLLLLLSQFAKRRAQTASQFMDGGRRFGVWNVFIMMTAMWGSSMFAVEIDTAYQSGISALWYGVSIIVSSLVVAAFLLKPFRNIGYLTSSHLLGQKYGNKARDVAALVIGITFPIFAMKNVLAAASYLHVILGWSLPIVLIATTLLVIIYVSLGGLWSLAYVQVANLLLFTVGLGVAAYFSFRGTRSVHVTHLQTLPVSFHDLFGVGASTLLVWFGMNLLNSVSAQAEFQTIASAKNVKKGKMGVYLSSVVLIAFAVVPAWLGVAARMGHPLQKNGLLAFPAYLKIVAPHWAIVLVGLGFWASALIWCAPLMFSGASSLGLDLLNRKSLSHNHDRIRRLVRLSMLIQGMMIVLYALTRPGDLAWWAVFGLTLRNAAIVGPTLSVLLWPAVREKTIVFSMIAGVLAGFGWNAVTGLSATVFPFGINPMWVGSGLSLLVILLGTLIENRDNLQWTAVKARRRWSAVFIFFCVALLILGVYLPKLHFQSFLGADLFLMIFTLFLATVLSTERIQDTSPVPFSMGNRVLS